MATKGKTTHRAAAGPETRALSIVAKRDGFRRAGRVFGSDATVLPLSELSPDEYEALTTEPMLVANEIDIKPDEAEA